MRAEYTTDNALLVRERTMAATGVVALTLERRDGRRLPDWAPGAHLDVILPNGVTRQYSLCGDRWDAYSYRIAVRREPGGRGGSSYVHDRLAVGDEIRVGGPRNNFPMAPADSYLFIAGGIGITPIIPMIAQANIVGARWQLLYLGRDLDTMPFLDELACFGDNVTAVASRAVGRTDLRARLDAADESTKVYACGPQEMLDELGSAAAGWPVGRLRIERFTAAVPTPSRKTPFVVGLARSRRRVTVYPDQSILDAVAVAGIKVLSSCREGVCGTCETAVIDGEPDHRDAILEPHERAAGECMFICVSRSCSDSLTLDL